MTETLLSVKDVATALKVSTRQVWKLASAGRIPKPHRLARSVRWREAEIADFIRRGCAVEAEAVQR